jgi:DNA polymerase II large subunit
VLWLIGLYIAEGFSRKNTSKKGYYQVSLAATEDFIRNKIIKTCRINFSLEPSRITKDAIIYSSKLFYLFFTKIFECGSIAKEKRIPKQALSFSKNRLKYILQGYFDGDGSTDKNCLRVSCDTISKGLMQDLSFVFSRYNIYLRKYEYTSKPGKIVRDFYIKKNRPVPSFTITKLSVPSIYCNIFAKEIGFSLPRKQKVLLNNLKLKKPSKLKIDHDKNFTYLKIKSITKTKEKLPTYCLNVKETSNFLANNMIVHNCDGDEAAVMLLMDSLLNFSRKFLPSSRGSTMDAPLVLTSFLDPAEVDDQVHGVDVMWNYPLEFYEAALEMKNPWEVKFGPDNKKIEQLADRLGTIKQYEDFGFTHHVDDINQAPLCSAYKTLPSMREKLVGQMEIAKKVRAVDMGDVAKLVIQKHFLKDIKGNLRKYSMQQFRCVGCNTKYRRPPLTNKCSNCHGKIIFTISQGSVVKYLGPSLLLAQKYEFSPYLKQTLDMLQLDVDHIFGREKEKQVGLGSFIK